MKQRKSERPDRGERTDGREGRAHRNHPDDDRRPRNAASGYSSLYGLNPILEALRSGRRQFEYISVLEGAREPRLRELLDLAKQARIPIRYKSRSEMERYLGNVVHQGVAARLAAARYADADDLIEELSGQTVGGTPPLAIALDGIEDPRNFGAILRTAECAGVRAVFTTERRAVGLTDVVAKTAAGALEYLRVARVSSLATLLAQLKERNIWVVGTAGDATDSYADWDWNLPTVIVFGGEGRGLHRLVRERCDTTIRIPLYGNVESLNVGVAAGVVLFEAARQRQRRSGI